MNFNKVKTITLRHIGYELSCEDFFIHTSRPYAVYRGCELEEVFIDVHTMSVVGDSYTVVVSNWYENFTIILDLKNKQRIELQEYCIGKIESNELLVLATVDGKKSYRDFRLYDIKQQQYISASFFPKRPFPLTTGVAIFSHYLVIKAWKKQNQPENILFVINTKTKEVVDLSDVYDELTIHVEKASGKIFPLVIVDGYFFAAFVDVNHPTIPRSILKINLVTKRIEKVLDKKIFPSHEYEKGKWNFAFYPRRFAYDAASRTLVSLANQGCYVYDIDRDEATFHSLADSLRKEGLNASGQVTLYENHLYFSCAGPVDREKGRINYHLFAYSLATHSIVWRYDFPKDYLPDYVAAPKVNENYLITHGSSKDLHIFKKMDL